MFRLIQNFKNIFHLFEAIIANIYYGFPSRKLKVIGVTGTDGKTTTANLIYHILKQNNKKVGLNSTVKTIVGGEEHDIGLHMTTPGRFMIQKLLNKALDKQEEYFVLEISSHALDQNRAYGINYEVSVLTNITQEHMDYHPSFDHYISTKAKLFINSKNSVINADDNSFEKIKNIMDKNNKKYYTYGLKNKADFNLDISKQLVLDLEEFNNYNYLGAYGAAKLLGLEDQQIFESMKTFKLPKGRMDLVYDKEFKVIIDFANTPNGYKNVLRAVRNKYLKNNGKIIHVFGAPGKRDREKRPVIGGLSAKYADQIILTSDDYRTEDPKKICEEIARGIYSKTKRFLDFARNDNFDKSQTNFYAIILDRREAIEKAISLAHKNDVILLTGIGHQRTLAQGRKEIPWDEEKVVLESVDKLL